MLHRHIFCSNPEQTNITPALQRAFLGFLVASIKQVETRGVQLVAISNQTAGFH